MTIPSFPRKAQKLTAASALEHFTGSRDCGISQSDIYLAPFPLNPGVSPFCKNRVTLLEALSSGGRHGFDEPFVGKGNFTTLPGSPYGTVIYEK